MMAAQTFIELKCLSGSSMESLGLMDLIDLCCKEAPNDEEHSLDVSRVTLNNFSNSRRTTKLYLKFVVISTLVTLLASNQAFIAVTFTTAIQQHLFS